MKKDELISLVYTMSFYSFQGKGNNRRATLQLALKGLVHKITRESGEHYSIDQSVQKAKMMKCMAVVK